MKFTKDFSEYRPWSGAVDAYDKIEKAGKLDELEVFLEEHFGDEIPSEYEINDLLWFDDEYVLNSLGLAEEEEPDLPTEVDCTLDDMCIDICEREEEDIDAAINKCGIEYLQDAVSPNFLKYTILGADFTRDFDKVHFYNIKWDTEE